jgi:hypothetical protein
MLGKVAQVALPAAQAIVGGIMGNQTPKPGEGLRDVGSFNFAKTVPFPGWSNSLVCHLQKAPMRVAADAQSAAALAINQINTLSELKAFSADQESDLKKTIDEYKKIRRDYVARCGQKAKLEMFRARRDTPAEFTQDNLRDIHKAMIHTAKVGNTFRIVCKVADEQTEAAMVKYGSMANMAKAMRMRPDMLGVGDNELGSFLSGLKKVLKGAGHVLTSVVNTVAPIAAQVVPIVASVL